MFSSPFWWWLMKTFCAVSLSWPVPGSDGSPGGGDTPWSHAVCRFCELSCSWTILPWGRMGSCLGLLFFLCNNLELFLNARHCAYEVLKCILLSSIVLRTLGCCCVLLPGPEFCSSMTSCLLNWSTVFCGYRPLNSLAEEFRGDWFSLLHKVICSLNQKLWRKECILYRSKPMINTSHAIIWTVFLLTIVSRI